MLMLLLSLVALGLGPMAYRRLAARPVMMRVFDAIVVVGVGILVVVDLLPHSFESAQWRAAIPLVLGLLGPSLVERFFLRAERQTHRVTMVVVSLGFFLHAAIDGAALNLDNSAAVASAIVLHRLPMGFVVWRLLCDDTGFVSRHGRAITVLMVILVATVAGYFGAEVFAPHQHADFQSPMLGMFQALVAGSLLHIVVHAFGHQHHH